MLEHTTQAQERRLARDSYRFAPDEPGSDGVVRVAGAQLELTIDMLRDTAGADDGGEAVHEARKALKRLRALLRVSREAIGKRRYRHESRILRDVGRALSGTRDAQVLLETFDALVAHYGGTLRDGTWSRLRASLASAAASSGVVDPEQTTSLVAVLSDTRERLATWPLSQDEGSEPLANGFARVYMRGRRAYDAARSDPTTESLHELRKRAKDLWHGAQLLETAAPEQMKAVVQTAHHLSDLLGEDHDLAILREHAQAQPELMSSVEHELLAALIRSRQEALRAQAMACAGNLYRAKPKSLLARLTFD